MIERIIAAPVSLDAAPRSRTCAAVQKPLDICEADLIPRSGSGGVRVLIARAPAGSIVTCLSLGVQACGVADVHTAVRLDDAPASVWLDVADVVYRETSCSARMVADALLMHPGCAVSGGRVTARGYLFAVRLRTRIQLVAASFHGDAAVSPAIPGSGLHAWLSASHTLEELGAVVLASGVMLLSVPRDDHRRR